MKKSLIPVILFLILIIPCYTQQIAVIVSDFKVESDDPSHKYLGKGLSRLVASELRKSARLKLLEREQMMRILEEQEFSLSDMANTESQVEVGMLMSADRIVFGEIIDMGNVLLISLRMADVETGEIVWQDEITERLRTYNYIAAFFAKSILTELELSVETSIVKKVEVREEKDEQAIIRLSEGIDAYDRGDEVEAKKALKIAKRIDPKNETIGYYLAKLAGNTSKFKVLTEAYYTYQNPAYLGLIETDRAFVSLNGDPLSLATLNHGIEQINYRYSEDIDVSEGETDTRFKTGYAFPVGGKAGVQVELIGFIILERLWFGREYQEYPAARDSSSTGFGGIVSAGFAVTESISLGFGITPYYVLDSGEGDFNRFTLAFNAGFLFRNADESFVFDTRFGYGTGKLCLHDVTTLEHYKDVNIPLFNENTFTFSLVRKNTFIVVKQINDISLDRVNYFGRILPSLEHYINEKTSFRVGIEGSYALLDGTPTLGFGALLGISWRKIEPSFETDLNLSYRLRPSRVVESLMIPQLAVMMNFCWNDRFGSRE
jgi:TolB-like protein